MINFTEPSITDQEKSYVLDALDNNLLSGDKKYTKLCTDWFNNYGYDNFLLTTSGSSALELAAILSKIQPGDEFIVPSFTFSSTANAFMLRGAKPIFVEINPYTMNIDADKIEDKITPNTKVIVPVDYPATWTKSTKSLKNTTSWSSKMPPRPSAVNIKVGLAVSIQILRASVFTKLKILPWAKAAQFISKTTN